MQNKKINTKAVLSLVCGCLSLLGCCIWFAGAALGLAAVILGVLAIREREALNRDIAVAGIVVGGVGFLMGVAVAVMFVAVCWMMPETASDVMVSLNSYQNF